SAVAKGSPDRADYSLREEGAPSAEALPVTETIKTIPFNPQTLFAAIAQQAPQLTFQLTAGRFDRLEEDALHLVFPPGASVAQAFTQRPETMEKIQKIASETLGRAVRLVVSTEEQKQTGENPMHVAAAAFFGRENVTIKDD
ncbi:MAG: hypothetical protein FWD16_03740, partial [Clostridia bacterium]|nr:hypothetical protein [Clostridia bacterium]